MKSKIYLFICTMLLCTMSICAQTVKVTGTVTDKTGAIVGATVKVKDSANGAIPDTDGHYSLAVHKGATLVFSFIGYNTVEKVVGNTNVINVELSDNIQQINEVVVTAIGIKQQKKKLKL